MKNESCPNTGLNLPLRYTHPLGFLRGESQQPQGKDLLEIMTFEKACSISKYPTEGDKLNSIQLGLPTSYLYEWTVND